MSIWNSRSISGKLTRINLLMSGTALVLAYISFLVYGLYTLRGNLISSLTAEASIVGENSVTALMFDDRQAAQATLSALQSSTQIQWAAIVRPDGTVFARYVRNASNPPELGARLGPGQRVGHWQRGQGILLASRIEFQGKAVGDVYLLASRLISPAALSNSASSPRAFCSFAFWLHFSLLRHFGGCSPSL